MLGKKREFIRQRNEVDNEAVARSAAKTQMLPVWRELVQKSRGAK